MSEVIFLIGLLDLVRNSLMYRSNGVYESRLKDLVEDFKILILELERDLEISRSTRIFVAKLQSVINDADILLDKTVYLASWRQQIMFTKLNKAVSICFCVPRTIPKICEALNDIAENSREYGVTIRDRPEHKEALARQTYSFVPVEEVIGRNKEKEDIIKMLQNIDLFAIAILGVGGLGKTTLAQFVFNDREICAYFEYRIWVSLSDVSGYRDIIIKIVESVGSHPTNSKSLESVLPQFHQHFRAKLFLLVLDDLSLDSYETGFMLRSVLDIGSRGSKVLVTTRSQQVARLIDAIPYELPLLSNESCWSLFERLAFEPGKSSTTPDLVKIGKEIVHNCGNVPLIVRLVANLLYLKGKDKWLQFTDKNRDIMDFFSHDNKDDLTKVLRPSYKELPYPLKLCFVYCSLFPRSYEFNKHDLVHLWMAQGFLESFKEDNTSLEDSGEDCFMGLLARCFFQDVKQDMVGDIISCRMHDMVHHLARNIAGGSVITCSEFADFDAKALHVSLIFNGNFPESLFRAHRTRSLVLFKDSACNGKLETSTCRLLISKFKHLRALDLHDCGIGMLPGNIGDLIHLRYLDLSNNDALVELPESLTKLYYLQTLKLNFCHKLTILPKDIGKLMMLRCLEIDECDSLTYMPLGLRKLTCLHTLNRFVVCMPGSRSGGLRVLKTLDNLRGRLKIELSGDWTAIVQEAAEAKLVCKTKLTDLKIEWRLGGLEDKQAYYYYGALLEGLQPPSSLEVLCIEGYRGKGFPSWARMDKLASYLPNLVIVSMEGCRECKYLPPFGQLKSLRCLTLRHMEEVQHVEKGAYDPQHSSTPVSFFPSLKELTLHSFHNLEGWWKEEGEIVQNVTLPSFPRLLKLKIWNCPKLTVMPLFPSVEEVNFQNVNQRLLEVFTCNAASASTSTILTSSPSSSSTSSMHRLASIASLQSHRDEKSGWLADLRHLKRLQIMACFSLKIFPTIGNGGISSVQHLVIDKCDALTNLAEGLQHLVALEELELSYCKALNFGDNMHDDNWPWISLTKLRYLTFRGLPKMKSLPKGLCTMKSLKFFWLATCDNLSELPEWVDELSSIQHFRIEACPMLQQLPQKICSLKNLVKLEIMECPKLLERCREPVGEDWLNIKHIPRVLLHKSWRYGLMNDAETLKISERLQSDFTTGSVNN